MGKQKKKSKESVSGLIKPLQLNEEAREQYQLRPNDLNENDQAWTDEYNDFSESRNNKSYVNRRTSQIIVTQVDSSRSGNK